MTDVLILPKKSFIGVDCLQDALPKIAALGKKALIVTGKSTGKSEISQALQKGLTELGQSYCLFDGITGEPTVAMIEAGVKVYEENACDYCIGLGGGSPIDAAKAIVLQKFYPEKTLADFMGVEVEADLPKIAAIPTTAGTGSEATRFTVITDEKTSVKMLLKGSALMPEVAVVDASAMTSCPKSVTAATGLDALTHAVEAYVSKKANFFTDFLALDAIKKIFAHLVTAYENGDQLAAREEMAIAAYEAGICINNSSVTIVHGMSRPIGALFHVPHGISNAMLLNVCLEFSLSGTFSRFADLGRAIGAANEKDFDDVAANKFLEAVKGLCQKCGVVSFAEYGIAQAEFLAAAPKMAEDALISGSPANTRREVTQDDIIALYQKLW